MAKVSTQRELDSELTPLPPSTRHGDMKWMNPVLTPILKDVMLTLLEYDKRDAVGKLGCDIQGMIGNHYVHHADGKKYEVTAVVWLADTDLWGVEHAEVVAQFKLNEVRIVRSWDNFFAVVGGNRRRMTQAMQG